MLVFKYVNYLEHYKGNFGVEEGRVRKGASGGYRKELRREEINSIDEIKKAEMMYEEGYSNY